MQQRHRKKLYGLSFLMLLGACGQPPEVRTETRVGQELEVLASVDLDPEISHKLEILTSRMEDGSHFLVYREYGPYGSKPLEGMDGQNGNPVDFLRRVAPGKPIPRKLIDFASQFDFNEETPIKELKPTAKGDVAPILEYQQGHHYTTIGSWNGAYGERCPFSLFASRIGPWGPSCPTDGGHQRWCFADSGWGKLDAKNILTKAAYNTVCTDYESSPITEPANATRLHNSTAHSQGYPVENEWVTYVSQGFWYQEYTKMLQKCNWWGGCTIPTAGLSFEVYGNLGNFHWGGRWEHW